MCHTACPKILVTLLGCIGPMDCNRGDAAERGEEEEDARLSARGQQEGYCLPLPD